ncbi:nickel-responsive transcriptional regulator NikR [Variovorax sp. LT2P21]|uniref:nickel-responsive transcriptional regulator NikR n=1 Tax=Variovorax sp. LT2P21 TaxID=3443731 RepID=UPI003F475F28
MQRFTISLDDELAQQFDALIAGKGYVNRSEAVRDLIRSGVGRETLEHDTAVGKAVWCVATVSYVYDRHEHTIISRLLELQHAHHDLVVTSLRTHLDHDHCMEAVVLRGPIADVQTCAELLLALRGVRHGNIHRVPLARSRPHAHGAAGTHTHLKPLN